MLYNTQLQNGAPSAIAPVRSASTSGMTIFSVYHFLFSCLSSGRDLSVAMPTNFITGYPHKFSQD
jgi:hypothetical protein